MGGRRLLVAVVAAALVLAAAALAAARGPAPGPAPGPGPATTPAAPAAEAPNVLVIVTDDARAETLQAMPRTRAWLGDGGVTFPQGFATTPSCCPSRASILSGRYVHNHGVLRQQLGHRLDQRTSLARYLKDAGYRTAMAGKFLNRWPLRQPPPFFDRWALANGGYYDQLWQVDGRLRRVPTYSTGFIGDRALEYLAEFERDDQRPWFAYLAPFAPHDPRVPEPRHATATFPALERVGGGRPPVAGKPAYLAGREPAGERAVAELRTGQLRTLLSVDGLVDRVMRRLRDSGELDDTLVFFLSDNGYAWGEQRHLGKFVPYTASIRVPFLVRWPGRLPAGTVDQRLVATIDIKPTVLAAAGLRPGPGDPVDGRSLLDGRPRDRLLVEYWRDQANAPGIRDWAALRGPGWQYIENYDQPGGAGTFREYYDLARDPGMDHNLLADVDPGNDPPASLAAELAAARTCQGASCP
jgi:arylsulfatase A-like enzyme